MISGVFINRERDLAFFAEELATTTAERNRVVLLVAPSGHGKSEFTEKVIADQRQAIGVKVRVPANVEGDAPFIHALAREIDRVARETGPFITGNAFLRGLVSESARKEHDSRELRDAAESVPIIGGLVSAVLRTRDRMTNVCEFDFDRLLRETARDSTVVLFEYVRHVFSKDRVCMAIENIQAIDSASEDMLKEIVSLQRGHFIVLEYTKDATHATRQDDDLRRILQTTGSEVKRVVLDHLALGEILARSGFHLEPDTLKNLYVEFDGNLRRLEDLVVISASESEHGMGGVRFSEATIDRVRALTPAAQFVLALVATHRSSASREALRSMYQHSRYLHEHHVDVDGAIGQLVASNLLIERRPLLEVAHDSITAELVARSEKYVDLAQHSWAHHYREKFESHDFGETSRDQVLDLLFSFYVKTDPAKLQPLLAEVRRVALASITTERASSILAAVASSIDQFRGAPAYRESVQWDLVDTYYAAGLWEDAHQRLNHITTRPMRATVYRAAVLDRLDRHQEALELIRSSLRSGALSNPSVALSLRLIEMICLRSINDYEGCERVYREIGEVEEYRTLPEYGFYLRNSEIVEPIVDSLPLLEESASRFQETGNATAQAQSLISFGMQLTRLGRLDEAERAIDHAASLLSDRRLDWSVIHNNRAVLTLRRPRWEKGAVDGMLRSALMTANIEFDRVAIKNNRLAAHAIAGDLAFCEVIARDLEENAADGSDEVLLCITYFNLSVFRSMQGHHTDATRLRTIARSYTNDWPEYWAQRFDGTPIERDPAAAYQAAFPFDLVLLSAWHIDVSDFGEH